MAIYVIKMSDKVSDNVSDKMSDKVDIAIVTPNS